MSFPFLPRFSNVEAERQMGAGVDLQVEDEKGFLMETQLIQLAEQLKATQAELHDLRQALERRTFYLGQHEALTRLRSGHKIYVDTRDVGICSHLMMDGHWEPWIAPVMMARVQPGMRVMDVGANFGYYTLLFASVVGPTGHVWSVEANPHISRFLKRSVSINGLGGWTTIVEKAAFDKDCEMFFNYDVEYSGGGFVSAGGTGAPALTTFKVTATPLDGVVDAEVHVIKLDVEGAEAQAIAGMRGIVGRSPSLSIIMEYNRDAFANASEFLEMMRAWGFSMKTIEPEGVSAPLTTAALIEAVGGRLTYILFSRID